MLCPFCGTYGAANDVICPACGRLLPRGENHDSGVMAIRQGKRARQEAQSGETPIWQRRQGTARVYVDPDTRPATGGQIPVFPTAQIFDADGTPVSDEREIERSLARQLYGEEEYAGRTGAAAPAVRRRSRPIRKHGFNWMILWIALAVLVVVSGVAAVVWLRATDEGHLFLVRHDYEINDSAAYWQVGRERMDTGDLDGAIDLFLRAAELEEAQSGRTNLDGLMMLATAYLSKGETEKAEEIYVHIYTDINPSSEEAYRREIELLRESGREAEAADLMLVAYRKTGSDTFRRQRNLLLPSQPVTDLTAAVFEQRRTMHLTSPEGYPIYYVMNNEEAVLFDEDRHITSDWILYDGSIYLDEGKWTIRAVCVNGELASDELSATYTVDLPSPHQPNCGLSPGTYEKKQRVYLWPNKEDEAKKKDGTVEKITIYYTIDGSIPDADSPIADRDVAIRLPAYSITLQAIAVNSYGKPSTVLERHFVIKAEKDPPKGYATDNPADIASVRLNSTTYDMFVSSFGQEERGEDVDMGNLGICRRCYYRWGYVTYQMVGTTRYLVEISYNTNEIESPRSTKIGMSETEITSKFRDMGQLESPSGNRGLYSNGDGIGKIYKQQDGTKIIRYIAYTADGHYWQLDYNLDRSGIVGSIYMLYIP